MISFISENIYQLKQEYGFPVALYKTISVETDLATGNILPTVAIRYIKRAVLLPRTLLRELFKSEYDTESRIFIFDCKDLGSYIIEKDDYIIDSAKKFLVNKIINFDYDLAVIVEAKESLGQDVLDHLTIESELSLDDSTKSTVA